MNRFLVIVILKTGSLLKSLPGGYPHSTLSTSGVQISLKMRESWTPLQLHPPTTQLILGPFSFKPPPLSNVLFKWQKQERMMEEVSESDSDLHVFVHSSQGWDRMKAYDKEAPGVETSSCTLMLPPVGLLNDAESQLSDQVALLRRVTDQRWGRDKNQIR